MGEQMQVTDNMLRSLDAARPWVRILAALGFVFTILMIFAGLALTLAFAVGPSKPALALFMGPALAIVFLVLAIFFCLIPGFFLLRHVSAISRIRGEGQIALEELLSSQEALWKYLAIFALVMLALLASILIGGIVVVLM